MLSAILDKQCADCFTGPLYTKLLGSLLLYGYRNNKFKLFSLKKSRTGKNLGIAFYTYMQNFSSTLINITKNILFYSKLI